jgi:hypothetical protein
MADEKDNNLPITDHPPQPDGSLTDGEPGYVNAGPIVRLGRNIRSFILGFLSFLRFRIPPPELDPKVRACLVRTSRANRSLASRVNHWWQNWGKNQAYICQRMFFPTNVYEIGAAIRAAERDEIPVRAVGGGWSFSDVTLPGHLTLPPDASGLPRPMALGVEALTEIVPAATIYSSDPNDPVIAEIAPPGPAPRDAAGSLLLLNPSTNAIDPATYLGGGRWSIILAGGGGGAPGTSIRDLFARGYRPVRAGGPDDAGTLAMFDTSTSAFVPSFFYSGGGIWISGVLGPSPQRQKLSELLPSLGTTIFPVVSNPAWSMSLLAMPKPVYLINTKTMASSLQETLYKIMSDEAKTQTDPGTFEEPNPRRKFYFHVEGGITMEDFSKLLRHQSPRLAIEASGGSPGATLAGALATATHGGEFRRPLLVDRVKAVHIVGPGGVQWWIEGSDSIADPDKLMEVYPCLSRDHIITGTEPIDWFRPQNWLDAVKVSMGCIGVIYSMVIEVVPIFGIHEVVVQSTWRNMLRDEIYNFPGRGYIPITVDDLRRPPEMLFDRERFGRALYAYFSSGRIGGFSIGANEYVDIAIDPNPIGSFTLGERDWNCWVLNREFTSVEAFDHKPPEEDLIGRVGQSIGESLGAVLDTDDLRNRFLDLYDVNISIDLLDPHDFVDVLDALLHHDPLRLDDLQPIQRMAERLLDSKDGINAILDVLTKPFEAPRDPYYTRMDFNIASAIVSGLFSGLLGVEGRRGEATDMVSRVGAIGFPASGIMGTAIEIAMHPKDAFIFLQNEILDQIENPFFGYVSIRFCPQTQALLGMQQHNSNVMIELVAFGTQSARDFVRDVQQRVADQIEDGLDAMLHWGLSNETLNASLVDRIPTINSGSPSKLTKFVSIRNLIAAPGTSSINVFDNSFTRRLGF